MASDLPLVQRSVVLVAMTSRFRYRDSAKSLPCEERKPGSTLRRRVIDAEDGKATDAGRYRRLHADASRMDPGVFQYPPYFGIFFISASLFPLSSSR